MGVLDGKAIVVTGSGRGLGRAYAIAMAAEGGRVVVNDIDADLAAEAAAEINARGGTAVASGDSVADWQASRRLIDQCVKEFGRIDVLVNNAALHHVTGFSQETEEVVDAFLAVNVKGTLITTRHALDHMISRKQGCIINVTSGAQSGMAGLAVYGTTKAAVAGFTYALAIEMAEHNIRVNALSPIGQTRMSANQEPGAGPPPENVAPLAVFLASDEAAYITGQVVRLDRNALAITSHPKPTSPAVNDKGWSLDEIRKGFRDAVGANLQPLGIRAKQYDYYEGLGKGNVP